MTLRPRQIRTRLLVALVLLAALPAVGYGASISGLNAQLGREHARQGALGQSIASLAGMISSLSRQISLVQGREADVRAALARDEASLAVSRHALSVQRTRLSMLRRRLSAARALLARQLVSSYEGGSQDLVSVLLNAHGFNDLLERITFLRMAEHEQQALIALTRQARSQAEQAQAHFAALTRTYSTLADGATIQARALAGMNALLQSRQASLDQARAIQQQALQASQSRAGELAGEIRKLQAEQAAAARAAAERAAALARQQSAAQSAAQSAPPSTSALGSTAGWAIPYPIVMCESGGQNLPPNSAGASGYYQILPSTWQGEGGTGPAAYLAAKAEQDAVAARLWNGGAGASNWVCAGIVGIH